MAEEILSAPKHQLDEKMGTAAQKSQKVQSPNSEVRKRPKSFRRFQNVSDISLGILIHPVELS